MKFKQGTNSSGCKEHCPVCGDYYHPSISDNVVLTDANGFSVPVCWDCVAVHAPEFLPDDIKSIMEIQ